MAGSIALSLSQQFDSLGKPLTGGLLYFYAAGTSTPQNAYRDTGLTLAYANPLTLDSAGRVPQLFFADGNIKVRLTDAQGNTQLAADNILVIGQSSGGGGGATVDPTTVLQTGWVQTIYGTGNITGFVRLNGRSIGSATSGATERSNADTSALYTFLYNADPNLAVAGGRGASAAADFAANKALTLPDFRGRGIGCLDDMGNSAAGRLTSTYFGSDATVLGNHGGGESSSLATVAKLPNVNFTGTATGGVIPANYDSFNINSLAGGVVTNVGHGQNTPTFSVTVASGGSGEAFATVSPMILVTAYIKL